MPMHSEFDRESRLVRTFAEGEITDQDLRDHHVAMFGDPAFDPAFDQLADFRRATPRVSPATVRLIAQGSRFSRDSRRAFVVSGELAYGLGRMFELSLRPDAGHVRVFVDIDEASRWLGQTLPRAGL